MTLKRSELRIEIMSRADDQGGAVAKPEEVNRWINLAVRTVWKYFPWSFTLDRTTVTAEADTALVEVPPDVRRPTRVVLTDNAKALEPVSERELHNRYLDTEGVPEAYCDGGLGFELDVNGNPDLTSAPTRRLRVAPVPNQDYDLELSYLRAAPMMTNDGHYFPMPDEFQEAVVLWCLVRYYRKLEDLGQSNEHNQAFHEELSSLVEDSSIWQAERNPSLPRDEVI